MTQMLPPSFKPATGLLDVFVIGGGPAGSTVATLLAMKGRNVGLADKDIHPRFHIGESLLPASMPLFEKLGVKDAIAGIGVAKYAAEFVSQYHGRTETFQFGDALDESQPYSYQVPRADFDHLLLSNAEAKGVAVQQGCKITSAERDAATGIWRIEGSQNGITQQWTCRYVVDASGRETFFGSKNGWKVKNPHHTSAAMYAHYQNVWRPEGQSGGNIQLYWFAHGWFWAIPLINGTTSIGAVCWPYYMKSRKVSVEQFFNDTIAMAPDLAKRLESSTRTSEVTATGNYTYKCSQNRGEGYMLIGDAYGFIDPLFSTGVLLATEAAAAAADDVHQLLENPAQEAALVNAHKVRMDKAMADFTWLIYRMPSPIMRDLMMTPKEKFTHASSLRSKRAVTSLLAGDVFSATRQQMVKHMRVFKLVYFLSCLRQPLRWWRHHQHRKTCLSG